MTNKDYPDSGILFANDRKGDNPRAPDRKGTGEVTCPHCQNRIELDLAGWVREGKRGPFLSLKLKPKTSSERRTSPTDEDIPF